MKDQASKLQPSREAPSTKSVRPGRMRWAMANGRWPIANSAVGLRQAGSNQVKVVKRMHLTCSESFRLCDLYWLTYVRIWAVIYGYGRFLAEKESVSFLARQDGQILFVRPEIKGNQGKSSPRAGKFFGIRRMNYGAARR